MQERRGRAIRKAAALSHLFRLSFWNSPSTSVGRAAHRYRPGLLTSGTAASVRTRIHEKMLARTAVQTPSGWKAVFEIVAASRQINRTPTRKFFQSAEFAAGTAPGIYSSSSGPESFPTAVICFLTHRRKLRAGVWHADQHESSELSLCLTKMQAQYGYCLLEKGEAE